MRAAVAAVCWIALALAPAACDQPMPTSQVEVFTWPNYPDDVPPSEVLLLRREATPPDQTVPPYLPIVPSLPPAAAMPVAPSPVPPRGGFAPGLPPGPVTNYGTGGMQQMPGAPPNPPYPSGGLGH